MKSRVATPKSTGGGGYTFEGKVSGWFLSCALADEPPLGANLGVLSKIEFQVGVDGWILDDLLLTLDAADGIHRCATSVKSGDQFTGGSAPADFVRSVWTQYLGHDKECFNRDRDYLLLVTVPLPHGTKRALNAVLSKVGAGGGELLVARYQEPRWASNAERHLFESLHCPPDIADEHGITPEDTGRLLSRVRVLEFDFESVPSTDDGRAVQRCRGTLKSGELSDATKLWDRLLRMASELRPNAGSVTTEDLVDQLRMDFQLRGLEDHREDWDRVHSYTLGAAESVRDSIGNRLHIPRAEEQERVRKAVDSSSRVALLGRSGVGKSAIMRRFALGRLLADETCLWLDARHLEGASLASLRSHLELKHGLPELLRATRESDAVLALDGLDRLSSQDVFDTLGALLRDAGCLDPESPWRLVVTCQTNEWPRLSGRLGQHGINAGEWYAIEVEQLAPEAMESVWRCFPQAQRLWTRETTRSLLTNLKILDLICHRLNSAPGVPADRWVGESSVAAWFWDDWVASGSQGPSRERFVMLLAEKLADKQRLSIPLDEFEVSDVNPLSGLVDEKICRQASGGSRVSFEHELYGDWARLRVLLSHIDEVPAFLEERIGFPLWHRAVRLLGAHLLEHESDAAAWRETYAACEGVGGIQDLLLESVVFAANPLLLLSGILPELLRDEGRLLRRLLKRFLAYATLPDQRVLSLVSLEGAELAAAEVKFRRPNWPYWPPVVHFLHEHRAEVVPLAPSELAQVVRLWLEHAPPGTVMRRESAEIGLMLGELAREAWLSRSTMGVFKDRKPYYRAALAGCGDLPNELVQFALTCAERTTEVLPDRIRRPDPEEPLPDPWPDGPRNRVDEHFRETVLDTPTLIPLVRVRAPAAREVVLSCIISPRSRFEWQDHRHVRSELDMDSGRQWGPPLYCHGPFLHFLKLDFAEGLELISRLVHFASERWSFFAEQEAREHQNSEEARDGHDPLRAAADDWHRPPGNLVVELEDGSRELLGDGRVYGWSAGLNTSPDVVAVALMALERYLYEGIDEGRDVTSEVQAIVDSCTSVALLKVLCDVGRRQQELFRGSLGPLLAVAEIYSWDIRARVSGRSHLMIGGFRHGDWFIKAAQEFNELPHRDRDLRHIALELVLTDADTRTRLERARAQWKTRLRSSEHEPLSEFLQQLVLMFDPEQWELVEDADHGQVVINKGLQDLQRVQSDDMRALNERGRLAVFPLDCRRMIDERSALDEEVLEAFWSELMSIARSAGLSAADGDGTQEESEHPPLGSGIQADGRATEDVVQSRTPQGALRALSSLIVRIRDAWRAGRQELLAEVAVSDDRLREDHANALAGGIALLCVLHLDWLRTHTERMRWSRSQLQALVLTPPKPEWFDVPESVSTFTWDCFVADAVPSLWASEPDDPNLRGLLAHCVFFHHYAAVGILFRRVMEHRALLADDCERLRCLGMRWAFVRDRLSFVKAAPGVEQVLSKRQLRRFGKAVAGWGRRQVEGFVARSSASTCGTWKTLDERRRFRSVDAVRADRKYDHRLDLTLVMAIHSWLPGVDDVRDEGERSGVIRFWQEALRYTVRQAEQEHEKHPDIGGYPRDEERRVLTGAAAALQFTRESDGQEDLWLPVFKLPGEMDCWPERFLQSFHSVGLGVDPTPPVYESALRRIVEHTLDGSEPAWPYHREVWTALLGLDGFTVGRWGERHRALVERNRDLFEHWALHKRVSAEHLTALAQWLGESAAVPIRLSGVVWLGKRLEEGLASDRHDEKRFADAVAALLDTVWREGEPELRKNEVALSAFRQVLNKLTEQQNGIAMDLVGRIGGLL